MNRNIMHPEPQEGDQRPRFLPPPVDILARSRGRNLETRRMGMRSKSGDSNVHVITARHMLLSGCRDDQTSADAYINGRWNGALSKTLIDAIKASDVASWIEIHKTVLANLSSGGYSQVPQLTGPEADLNKPPFKR